MIFPTYNAFLRYSAYYGKMEAAATHIWTMELGDVSLTDTQHSTS